MRCFSYQISYQSADNSGIDVYNSQRAKKNSKLQYNFEKEGKEKTPDVYIKDIYESKLKVQLKL